MNREIKFCFLFILALFSLTATADDEEPDYSALTIKMRQGVLAEGYAKRPKDIFSVEKAKGQKETWCFVGDSGVSGRAQENVAKILVKENRSCDRVYHLGDIVYPTGITSSSDPSLTANFLKYQAPFEVPFSYVLGDHEYYALKIDPWLEVAKEHKNLNFPFYFYGQNMDGVCVVAGDTTPFYRGQISDPKPKEQIEWLEKVLPKYLKACSFKIFIAHHSYDSMNTERKPPKEAYKQPLREFFEKQVLGKFDIVFSGHDHALAYVGNFKGTEQYISGAGGKYSKDDDDRMDFEHYIGHKGPGLIYLDIFRRKPFQGEVRIVALEGKDLSKKKLVFRKMYGER